MVNQAEESICGEFGRRIWTKFRRGVRDYRLINEGDRIAVCISGGKDSILMALCIRRLQRNKEIPFEAEYIVMNPGYSEENAEKTLMPMMPPMSERMINILSAFSIGYSLLLHGFYLIKGGNTSFHHRTAETVFLQGMNACNGGSSRSAYIIL